VLTSVTNAGKVRHRLVAEPVSAATSPVNHAQEQALAIVTPATTAQLTQEASAFVIAAFVSQNNSGVSPNARSDLKT